MKYVIFGIIALLFLKAGWKKLAENFEGFSAKFSGISFDLSTTTPGKAVESLLGEGWANWLLWGAGILIVVLLILRLTQGRRSSSSSTGGGFVLTLMGIGLAIAVTSAYIGSKDTGVLNKLQTADIYVDLTKVSPGEQVIVRMGITSTAKVTIKAPPQMDGRTAYGICGKVTGPDWVKENKEVPVKHLEFFNPRVGEQHDLRLTEEMQKFLIKNEVTSATVTFTMVLTTVGVPAPC